MTRPTNSCPMAMGVFTGICPRWMCTSVPHTPLAASSSCAMPGAGAVRGYSRTSKGWLGPIMTASFPVGISHVSFSFLVLLTLYGRRETGGAEGD